MALVARCQDGCSEEMWYRQPPVKLILEGGGGRAWFEVWSTAYWLSWILTTPTPGVMAEHKLKSTQLVWWIWMRLQYPCTSILTTTPNIVLWRHIFRVNALLSTSSHTWWFSAIAVGCPFHSGSLNIAFLTVCRVPSINMQHLYTPHIRYFQQMVSLYEAKMQLYRQQIEELESHLSALASDHAISPQSKFNCLVWLHCTYEVSNLRLEPFWLAALVYSIPIFVAIQ